MLKTLPKIIQKTTILFLSLALLLTASGCGKKNIESGAAEDETSSIIELTYYRLFDNEEIFEPLIKTYESEHPNIRINYKKFTDQDEYMDLIINELAEGEGPDIFSLPNTAFLEHHRKLTPAPQDILFATEFESTFVPLAAKDLIGTDEKGEKKVYGMPLYVDTLALYYNTDEKPGATWSEIQEDVLKLNEPDQSFERFKRAGIAMGRGDNILRATDLLYALFLQFGVDFYDSTVSEVTFAEGVNPPAVEALNLILSFGLPSSPYYSWNAYLAPAESAEKEVLAFMRGKVSMIFGYSYLYDQLKGSEGITENSIRVAPFPQLEDPLTKPEARTAYASYFAETVSRTSQHPDEAWEFLKFLSSAENLEYYHEKTHRPSSRQDLLDEQKEEPLYGVFAEQVEYAKTLPLLNGKKYEAVLRNAIQETLSDKTPAEALQEAQTQINEP